MSALHKKFRAEETRTVFQVAVYFYYTLLIKFGDSFVTTFISLKKFLLSLERFMSMKIQNHN